MTSRHRCAAAIRDINPRHAGWRTVREPRQARLSWLLALPHAASLPLHEDDLGLRDDDVDQREDGGYYARWGEQAPQRRGEHAGVHTTYTVEGG